MNKTIVRYVTRLLSLSITAFCAGLYHYGLAQEAVTSNKVNINKALSLRLTARQIRLERQTSSPLKVDNGSTVVFHNGSLAGVISSSRSTDPIKLVPNTSMSEVTRKAVRPIEMRVFDRKIYLDRPVELFTVQDVTGRTIMTVVNSNKITLNNLRSGVYVVRVQDKGATHTSKFILR